MTRFAERTPARPVVRVDAETYAALTLRAVELDVPTKSLLEEAVRELSAPASVSRTMPMRSLRERRAAANLCGTCGKRAPKPGRKTCTVCIAEAGGLRLSRTAAGDRADCTERAMRGRKRCQKHLDADKARKAKP